MDNQVVAQDLWQRIVSAVEIDDKIAVAWIAEALREAKREMKETCARRVIARANYAAELRLKCCSGTCGALADEILRLEA